MKLSEITYNLETFAPLSLQESYDNSGLLVGNSGSEIKRALVALDVTDEVVREAIDTDSQLIIAHHPLIFKSLKRLTGKTMTERLVAKAVKNDIAIYAMHTNLDNVDEGVNAALCRKLGLKNSRILAPKKDLLRKLVTFCPINDAVKVREALFKAGAGHIGNYDSCSFNAAGTGTFRGSEVSNPYVGEKEKLHHEKEIRIETIYPVYRERQVVSALLSAHPYEEVAYDLYTLSNDFSRTGSGMVGELESESDEKEFLENVKKITGTGCIRHSAFTGNKIRKVAVCGGAGSFLIRDAISAQAQVFITGDVKYHDFFEGDGKILIADIGHYESEQFVKELLYQFLIKKFSNFAVLISKVNTNSVNYL